MKVLVTGATGLIGSAVVRRLTADGHAVSAPTRDVCDLRGPNDTTEWGRFLRDYVDPADVVVHCAARLGGVAQQKADPSMPVIDSLLMGAQVIDACAKAKAKLIFFSSTTVYPMSQLAVESRTETSAVLTREHCASEWWPRQPEALYRGVGGMKIYLEDLIDFYADAFALRATILRPTAVYGPGDRSGHVIPDLIRRADGGEIPLVVWGSPSTVRDFVFVDDVADAVSAVVRKDVWGEVLNVGSGARTTIEELANEVLVAVHGPHKMAEFDDRYSGGVLRFDESKPTAIPWRQVSIQRALEVLGWAPKVTLHDGIRRTLSWWRAQQSAQAGHA